MIQSLPRHHYVLVDSVFTHKEPCGFVPAVWFGLVSQPSRCWGLNVLLECGAIYRALPPHAVAFKADATPWTVREAQTWDCYGENFQVHEYAYLREMRCTAMIPMGLREERGSYLFTAVPIGDGFSAYPEQAKEFSFIELENGRLTIQPTDLVLFEDASFTKASGWPRGLKRQVDSWSCE